MTKLQHKYAFSSRQASFTCTNLHYTDIVVKMLLKTMQIATGLLVYTRPHTQSASLTESMQLVLQTDAIV